MQRYGDGSFFDSCVGMDSFSNLKILTVLAAVSAGATLIAGCSSEPTCDYSKAPYMSASSVPPLKAPEGLSAPDRSGALVVPAAQPNTAPPGKSKCLDRPPSYFSTTPKPSEPQPEKK